MELLYYLLAFGGMVANLSTAFFVKIKKILILQLTCNILITLSYVCISKLSGAVTCAVACVLILINFFYRNKAKPIPKWLMILECIAMVMANLFFYRFWYDILAIGAGILFAMEISQDDGRFFRRVALINLLFWLAYNLIAQAWANLIVQIVLIAFNRYGHSKDVKKLKEINSKGNLA